MIDRTAAFIGRPISPNERAALLDHLSFESMKKNPHINLDEITQLLTQVHGVPRKTHFIRKGQVGGWKEELTPRANAALDEWIKKNRIPGLWDNIL